MPFDRSVTISCICLLLAALIPLNHAAAEQEVFGPEEIVQAGGIDIDVPGFSVPSLVHWDGDELPDLVVGEGGLGLDDGKVRVYLNIGSVQSPVFGDYFYAQSNGSDLASPSGG